MKSIILFVLIILAFLAVVKLSNYQDRMDEYNRHVCAVYGKESDCRTPLTPDKRLK